MFEGHGTHRIQVIGNIVRIDAFDAWNQQHSEDFVAALRVIIDE